MGDHDGKSPGSASRVLRMRAQGGGPDAHLLGGHISAISARKYGVIWARLADNSAAGGDRVW